ncbi:MAG: helix-turn-helix domain-containing protein, partial [Chloroflexota bacterium]
MASGFFLADVLGEYVHRRGYTVGQLAKLSGLPKRTIANWLAGRVARPRVSHDLLKVAQVLNLNAEEVSKLLETVGHPSLAELKQVAQRDKDDELEKLLTTWSSHQFGLPLQEGAQPEAEARLGFIPPTMPVPTPHFIGRQEDLDILKRRLLDGPVATRTALQGMGGIGKTALALQLSHDLDDFFSGGIFWAAMATYKGSPRPILRSWVRLCGHDFPGE